MQSCVGSSVKGWSSVQSNGVARRSASWDSAHTTQGLVDGCCKKVKILTAESGHKKQGSGSMWAGSGLCLCEERCGEPCWVCDERKRTNSRERDFSVHLIACRHRNMSGYFAINGIRCILSQMYFSEDLG